MRPASNLLFNNFNTYEWLDYQYSSQFNGGKDAKGLDRPALTDEFDNVAGKKKLCKSAGLSGAEKKACMKNIRDTCGKKPSGFLGIKGRRKKEKQAVWSKCANDAVVTPEESAQETADKLIPTREEAGLGTGAKVMIGVGVLGFLVLVGFAVANKRKAQPAMMAQPSAMARR